MTGRFYTNNQTNQFQKGAAGSRSALFDYTGIFQNPQAVRTADLSDVRNQLEVFQLRFAVNIPLPVPRGLLDCDASGHAVACDHVDEALAVRSRDLQNRAGAEDGLRAVVQRDGNIPHNGQAPSGVSTSSCRA